MSDPQRSELLQQLLNMMAWMKEMQTEWGKVGPLLESLADRMIDLHRRVAKLEEPWKEP